MARATAASGSRSSSSGSIRPSCSTGSSSCAASSGMTVVRARSRRRQGGARSAQAQRGRVPAVRPRHRRPWRRGRVLRRTHDACRPGPPRSASGPGHRSCRPRSISPPRYNGHFGLVRPPLDTTRSGSLRDDVARVTQQLAARAGAADPPSAPAMAPVPTQLAVRPGIRRKPQVDRSRFSLRRRRRDAPVTQSPRHRLRAPAG